VPPMKRVGCGHAGPKSTAWISCAPVCLRGGCKMMGANYKLPYVQSSSTCEECSSAVCLSILFNNPFLDIYIIKLSGWFQSWTRNDKWQQCKATNSPGICLERLLATIKILATITNFRAQIADMTIWIWNGSTCDVWCKFS